MTGRIEKIEAEFDISIRWTVFPLHPETPPEGRSLEALFAGRGMDIPQMIAHLQSVARGLGLPFGERTTTYNSRRAQELGKWAEEEGVGDRFHQAVFRAYFADGLNIAQLQVLRNLAMQVGLDAEQAIHVLETGRYAPQVDDDWERSKRYGIRAVPSFRLEDEILVGAQKTEVLQQFLLAHRVPRRSPGE